MPHMTERNEIRKTLSLIDGQIEVLRQSEGSLVAPTWQNLRNSDGDYLATPLLQARAQCVLALATLAAAEVKR